MYVPPLQNPSRWGLSLLWGENKRQQSVYHRGNVNWNQIFNNNNNVNDGDIKSTNDNKSNSATQTRNIKLDSVYDKEENFTVSSIPNPVHDQRNNRKSKKSKSERARQSKFR